MIGLWTLVILAQAPDMAALYKERCAICHNESNPRAQSFEAMRERTPESIVTALMTGPMRVQGASLSGVERRKIAEYITGRKMAGDARGDVRGKCAAPAPFTLAPAAPIWNGWGPSHTNTRFQPAAEARLAAADVPKLKLKWALGYPDATSAWAQPVVAGGRVFAGSQNGTVFSLDAKTGCIHWTFSANGGVRTAISIGPHQGRHAVFFGDTNANVYALDAATGRKLWMRQVDRHALARVTGAPVLYGNRLYVPVSSFEEVQGASPDYECCTFRGSVLALDATTGEIIWKTYTIAAEPKPRGKSSSGKILWGPSGAAIWSSPAVDVKRRLVYAATGNTYSEPAQPTSDAVIAFDMATGAIRWSRQATPNDTFVIGCRGGGSANPNCPPVNGPDHDFGNAPILAAAAGRDVIVIGQKSGVGYAMDPEKEGEILWRYRAGDGGALGGMEWGSAADAENVYFPVSDITRPKPGGLHAVNLRTGARVWHMPAPPPVCGGGRGCNGAQSAAITVIPGVVFSGSNDGALRGYSTRDGAILWEYDTNREFPTTNGVAAKGGSMQGPGPAVAGGMLFVNAGYGAFGGRPGNVLLAFGVD